MDEGRFRRDFLNQWASSDDPMTDLRQALIAANEAATTHLGSVLWRALPRDFELEFQSLIGPLSNDPAALNLPVLVLTKTLVDALDSKLLKRTITDAKEGEQSLSLLRKYLNGLGDQNDLSKILHDLQALRSRGGIAHLPNSGSAKTQSFMNIKEHGVVRAFDKTLVQLAVTFNRIAELLQSTAANNSRG